MDSPKIQPDSEECSKNESGWTKYLASPGESDNDPDNDDDEEEEKDRSIKEKESDEQDDEDDGSDDSMASDATSGPRDMDKYKHGLVQAGNKNERKITGKKLEEKKQDGKQKKAAKDKSGRKDDGAGKSEKRFK